MDIELLRKEIDELDKEIKKLFLRRMEVARLIGDYKKSKGLPIEDKERETIIIKERSEDINEPLKSLYVDFLKEQIKLSKEYQK